MLPPATPVSMRMFAPTGQRRWAMCPGLGKKVLVSPYWTQKISWSESMVYVNLTKGAIKNSPEWNPEDLVNRQYEERLYDYYGRPAYWSQGSSKDSFLFSPPVL